MTDETTPSPRMSLSRVVEMLLQRGSDHSSVTLTRNAKGETQIDVAIRTGTQGEFATLAEAETKAAEVYDRLRERYPLAPHGDDSKVSLTRNAKGDTQIALELKSEPEPGGATVEQARDRAAEIYENLRARFPAADGSVGS